ncbi:MAG TPA: glycosyltransferase family 1 protein [Leptospiraceae bacterium]|nr:glycosyltransferase family 4 protein [Leptospirales bacterium]HMX55531.1 glycosyltransferase family 1 protein [Leptospiraceae bacterium]HMZ35860.1 glycosyltransferase family 1 protein [Leptospiraceae bacterium]HNE23124.1 glycosyltransferase family 1 protein [Leptospiraceae bacterium]HNJ34723.1 glycosyltransferase family 1 protein [Leptospiraceae bacterium]
MKIGVDARPLAYAGNGNARYLFDMLRGAESGHDFVLYSHRPIHSDYRSTLDRLGVSFRIDQSWTSRAGLLFLNFRLPGWLKEDLCDVYWGSLSMLPFFYKQRVQIPSMVNFHDLNAFVAADTMTKANALQHGLTNGHTLRNADRVLCLSQTTANDIARFFPAVKNKLEVVYPGIELKPIRPIAPEGTPGKLRHFYLMVGTIEPRKNQNTVIDAYLKLKQELTSKHKLPPLVIVGRKGWGADVLFERLSSGILEKDGIYYIAGASDAVLEWCYKNSSLYLFPSVHEGFGLPILEAAFRGIPLALSDIPIFREVGGKSAFAAPFDIQAWQEILRKPPKKAPAFNKKVWSIENRAKKITQIVREIAEIRTTGRKQDS